jgi:hypothetical protein
VLTVTTNNNGEANSAFYAVKMPTNAFTASFVYQATGNNMADGSTFCLQNVGTTALGNGGGSLGYNGNTLNTGAAVEFNVYGGHTIGTAYANNGNSGNYNATGNVNLASQDPILVQLSYNGVAQTRPITTLTSPPMPAGPRPI